MVKLFAVPYSDYRQTPFIVDYLRTQLNIVEFNKSQLSLRDIQGNIYYLFNDPNKVQGFQFSGIVMDPQFEYDSFLLDTIKARVRN